MQKFVMYYAPESDFTTNSENINKTFTVLQSVTNNDK